MKVNITLYKTNFDEENPFVSTSKTQRALDIEAKFNENKLLMENASFNIETPFRIAKNFFDLDKKYNYAKYEYYNGNELKDTRFYFIRNFKYISDNVTDMIVSEDIIGEHFWDLDIKYCMPKKITCKIEDIQDRIYNTDASFSNSFIVGNEENYLFFKNVKIGDNEYKKVYFGLIFISALTDDVTDDVDANNNIKCKYTEFGVDYYISTFVVPFCCDENGKVLNNRFTNAKWTNNWGSTNYEEREVGVSNFLNIDNFRDLSKISTNGFKYVSSFISFDVRDFVNDVYFQTSDDTYWSESLNFQMIFNRNVVKYATVERYENYTISLMKLEHVEPTLHRKSIFANYNSIYPYKNIQVSVDGTFSSINPSSVDISNRYYMHFDVVQSLVPPYELTISYNSSKITKNYTQFQRNSSFIYIDDTYTEWLKSNRNSAITGLATKQNYEGFINEHQALTNFGKGMINTVVGANKAYSSGGGGAQALLQLGAGTMTSVMDYVSSVETFKKNAEKDRALLELKLQDIQNTPDSITMGNCIKTIFSTKKYFRIVELSNSRLEQILYKNNMFGYENGKRIQTFRFHQRYDYLQSSTITLSFKNGFTPNEIERTNIEDTISKGIRYWYDIDNYKNFDVANGEIEQNE